MGDCAETAGELEEETAEEETPTQPDPCVEPKDEDPDKGRKRKVAKDTQKEKEAKTEEKDEKRRQGKDAEKDRKKQTDQDDEKGREKDAKEKKRKRRKGKDDDKDRDKDAREQKKKSRKGTDDDKDMEKDAKGKKEKSRKGNDAREDKEKKRRRTDKEKKDRNDARTKEEKTTKGKRRKRRHEEEEEEHDEEEEEHDEEEEEEETQNGGIPKVARRATCKTRGKAAFAKKTSAKPAAEEKEASTDPGAKGNSSPMKRPATKTRSKRCKLGESAELPAVGVADARPPQVRLGGIPIGPPTMRDPFMEELNFSDTDEGIATPPLAGLRVWLQRCPMLPRAI